MLAKRGWSGITVFWSGCPSSRGPTTAVSGRIQSGRTDWTPESDESNEFYLAEKRGYVTKIIQ